VHGNQYEFIYLFYRNAAFKSQSSRFPTVYFKPVRIYIEPQSIAGLLVYPASAITAI